MYDKMILHVCEEDKLMKKLKNKKKQHKMRISASKAARRSGKVTKREGKVSKSKGRTKTPRSQKKIATIKKSRY